MAKTFRLPPSFYWWPRPRKPKQGSTHFADRGTGTKSSDRKMSWRTRVATTSSAFEPNSRMAIRGSSKPPVSVPPVHQQRRDARHRDQPRPASDADAGGEVPVRPRGRRTFGKKVLKAVRRLSPLVHRNNNLNFTLEAKMIRNRLMHCVFVAATTILPAIELAGAASAQDAPKFVVAKVAERPLTGLPPGDLYWTAETFPTLDAAQAVTTETAVAVEIDGVAWLLTLGPEDKVGHGGHWMTSIGPIDRFDAPSYMLRINVSDAPPGNRDQRPLASGLGGNVCDLGRGDGELGPARSPSSRPAKAARASRRTRRCSPPAPATQR